MRFRSLLLLCVLLAAPVFSVSAAFQSSQPAGAEATTQSQPQVNRPALWVIPHTHWEGAVFETREEAVRFVRQG